MAGVKGRSGGPRPNSGGARPGAGRPTKEEQARRAAAAAEAAAIAAKQPALPPVVEKPKVMKAAAPKKTPPKPKPKPPAKKKARKKTRRSSPRNRQHTAPAVVSVQGPERPNVETVMEAQPHGGSLKRNQAAAVDLTEMLDGETDMLEVLKKIALGQVYASPTQVKAAIAVLPYERQKPGEQGKKEQKAEKAEKAATGRFGSAPPPSTTSGVTH